MIKFTKVLWGFPLCVILILQICILAKPEQKKQYFQYPVSNPVVIRSGWGERVNPLVLSNIGGPANKAWHLGLDFVAKKGTKVKASMGGVCLTAEWRADSGFTIFLFHGRFSTMYGHLSQLMVSAGESVTQGQVIGLSGNTGKRTTGEHLHFALFDQSSMEYVNPTTYFIRE